jgi:hypothetical protein
VFWRRCPRRETRREKCSGGKTFGCSEGIQPFFVRDASFVYLLISLLNAYFKLREL